MTEFQCSVDGCDAIKHEAKGMCRMHYRRTIPRSPDIIVEATCDGCGSRFNTPKRQRRWPRQYCGNLCRDYTAWGPLTCVWPKPAKKTRTPKPKLEWPTLGGTLVAGNCLDCGEPFVTITRTGLAKFCSERCATRTSRRARRAREHRAKGTFRFSEVMRQYQRQGYVCAYCEQPADGRLDPEHVVPLSRGGRNDMSNIVASCRLCNSDKCDLTLEQWAADRAKRGLPPVNTALYGADSRYTHLAQSEAKGESYRWMLVAA